MDFRIADTFTDSLARLTGDDQKSVKTTAFDLQMNPVNPGMSLHKLDKAKDANFRSVRVSSDIRLIVRKTTTSLLLCYVDHHDKAYQWAEPRRSWRFASGSRRFRFRRMWRSIRRCGCASSQSTARPIWKRSATPSATGCTSPAPEFAPDYSFPGSSRSRNFLMT